VKHSSIRLGVVVAAVAVVGLGAVALADGGRSNFREQLTGYDEVPALSTPGGGSFRARIRDDRVDYELTFSALESDVTQAHLHFENATNNGPIVVFLCTNLGNGLPTTQPCPAGGGTISGTITAEDVSTSAASAGAVANGIAAGEFAELVNAIRSSAIYVNVHSMGRPGGEIRAQLHG
jgi:hypothetical protein